MISREIEIINKLGLHARASAKLTQIASQYTADIGITRNNKRVNAKSIMGVMMLAASRGSTVILDCNGTDEEQAMNALIQLINNKFDEEE
jgi:phosphocarrier protein